VPVTARLSQRFYEKFGEDLAKELVDWFNDVDATYRADLRELNELNFARFDAKVEQRFAQADARLEQRLAQVEGRLEQRIAGVEVKLEALKSELIKWMFLFWTGSALANLLIRR
jgi:ABC-type phosphate transport system auxiliary subunit